MYALWKFGIVFATTNYVEAISSKILALHKVLLILECGIWFSQKFCDSNINYNEQPMRWYRVFLNLQDSCFVLIFHLFTCNIKFVTFLRHKVFQILQASIVHIFINLLCNSDYCWPETLWLKKRLPRIFLIKGVIYNRWKLIIFFETFTLFAWCSIDFVTVSVLNTIFTGSDRRVPGTPTAYVIRQNILK